MDLFTAMKERRSCRHYLPEAVNEDTIEKILEAATWAPSPLNTQPWEFIVITNKEVKEKIFEEANRCRVWALETSHWKWLDTYPVDFLKEVPVIIAVIGDPKKTGVDMFMEEGMMGYLSACSAAIQNMHLAAYSYGLGTLWFTLFDKKALRGILNIDTAKTPIALICLGKKADEPAPLPRKGVREKTTYIR
ncbi:MAG: 5,6-dimethylbenzimidazole synthase [Syntrophorhabdus sp. PtaU1.Bin058]|nr:MAG: 5,6-dimethylbenzimidazole synthase [Syntrophorhabdus sp. PtaU1.Bin058]